MSASQDTQFGNLHGYDEKDSRPQFKQSKQCLLYNWNDQQNWIYFCLEVQLDNSLSVQCDS